MESGQKEREEYRLTEGLIPCRDMQDILQMEKEKEVPLARCGGGGKKLSMGQKLTIGGQRGLGAP